MLLRKIILTKRKLWKIKKKVKWKRDNNKLQKDWKVQELWFKQLSLDILCLMEKLGNNRNQSREKLEVNLELETLQNQKIKTTNSNPKEIDQHQRKVMFLLSLKKLKDLTLKKVMHQLNLEKLDPLLQNQKERKIKAKLKLASLNQKIKVNWKNQIRAKLFLKRATKKNQSQEKVFKNLNKLKEKDQDLKKHQKANLSWENPKLNNKSQTLKAINLKIQNNSIKSLKKEKPKVNDLFYFLSLKFLSK